MIREIVTDPILLSRPSREATMEDLTIAADLKDTLRAMRITAPEWPLT